MEYTIKDLGKLAGVSSRTLRYYDEIDLLKPARINSSGYRIYGRKEVDILQQILFYRELGVALNDIKAIITDMSFNAEKALLKHHKKLLDKRRQIDLLIANVEKTIQYNKGGIMMSDQEKFKGLKQKMIDENERKYGKEICGLYGKETVEKSNRKFQNMTEEQFKKAKELSAQLMELLVKAFKTEEPSGELAQKSADLHRQWLCYYWDSYSKEAHAGLANMYVEDQRFKDFYDKEQPGLAVFLRDAIFIYTGQSK